MSHVDIGFIEKCEPWLLHSCFFPSKVGGKPSWLSFKDLPSDLECTICRKPLIFLCQVYAPFEDKDSCFHRTLFIFVCKDSSCCKSNESSNFTVFRSQLGRKNEFYSYEPPVEKESSCFDLKKYANLCVVCGCAASKHCGKCKVVPYCSKEHQVIDWKAGHKTCCCTDVNTERSYQNVLFDEWDLLTEEEVVPEQKEEDEESEKKRLEEYEGLVNENNTGTLSDIPESDLQSYSNADSDKAFQNFRKRVTHNPDQILRYQRNGKPLWIAKSPVPDSVPNCEYCGEQREFEFQILPQLLYKIRENNLDWGVVCVYTCKSSCDGGESYKREFVFKQDVV